MTWPMFRHSSVQKGLIEEQGLEPNSIGTKTLTIRSSRLEKAALQDTDDAGYTLMTEQGCKCPYR